MSRRGIKWGTLPIHVQRAIEKQATVKQSSTVADKPKREIPKAFSNVRRTVYDGVTYASKAEARRAEELDRMVLLKHIHRWVAQPQLDLSGLNYRPDFVVYENSGGSPSWYEDVKGRQSREFTKMLGVWLRVGPGHLRILKDSRDGRWITTVVPGAKGNK